jgi:hypothetical protein
MPFVLMTGAFRVIGQSRGKASGFEPDGDSVQFLPDTPDLLKRLVVLDQPVKPTSIGSVQLRMEGIDALELHFQPDIKGAHNVHQPRPLADDARDALTTGLGLGAIGYAPPAGLRAVAPVLHDGARGWILSRALDVHGRPVSFLFAGRTRKADGQSVNLTVAAVKDSINFQQLATGNAYPLFYDTLFADLRDALAGAAASAKSAGAGVWAGDRTTQGFDGTSTTRIEASVPIFPKLFRRLAEFYGVPGAQLDTFLEWLAAKGEQVLDLDEPGRFTHFDTFVAVRGKRVRLTKAPDRLVFISDKGKRRPNQPVPPPGTTLAV